MALNPQRRLLLARRIFAALTRPALIHPAVTRAALITILALSAATLCAGIPASAQSPPAKHPGKPCISLAEAAQNTNKDICVQAHIYDVVELPDGTRFLDVCPATVPDDDCRFFFLSHQADRQEVGDLHRFRDQDVTVRGVVHSMHGRMGILISHVRQFSGGPEKFRPNPRLLRGFNAESDRMPVHDPNLIGSGRHRSFMNNRDQEPLPRSKP